MGMGQGEPGGIPGHTPKRTRRDSPPCAGADPAGFPAMRRSGPGRIPRYAPGRFAQSCPAGASSLLRSTSHILPVSGIPDALPTSALCMPCRCRCLGRSACPGVSGFLPVPGSRCILPAHGDSDAIPAPAAEMPCRYTAIHVPCRFRIPDAMPAPCDQCSTGVVEDQ